MEVVRGMGGFTPRRRARTFGLSLCEAGEAPPALSIVDRMLKALTGAAEIGSFLSNAPPVAE